MVASRLGVGWTFQPQEPIRMADHRRMWARQPISQIKIAAGM
jgi:hypothetical protein